jgi:hypothetical protein
MSYNPIPPRVWSRVQDKCSTNTDTSQLVYVPLTNSYESLSKFNYDKQMLLKGNVLQYKNNSSNLTKKQRYTQIAKGQSAGRRKCFAAQSETYTNPNTSSFQRVNYVTIPFPNNIVGAPNNVSGPFQYDVPNPFGCNTTVLEDGGSLVGNTYVNPCTQEVVRTTYNQPCNLTSASDVPGPVQALCWDPKVATWYPRQRYVMPTSGTKWPEGYKGLVSAVTPIPPILSLESNTDYPIRLSWIFKNCSLVSNFYIYQNDVLIQVLPYTKTSTYVYSNFVPLQTYTFKIKSASSKLESEFSNSVSFTIPQLNAPLLEVPHVDVYNVILNWHVDKKLTIDCYNVYQADVLIKTVHETTTTIIGLTPSSTYGFCVSYISFDKESAKSNIVNVNLPLPETPILSPIVNINPVILNWSVTNALINNFKIYQNSVFLREVSGTTTATINELIPSTNYTFGISSVIYGTESIVSITQSITPTIFKVTGDPLIIFSKLNEINYCYITFTKNGSINFLENIDNVNIICVGGGGGGGGGAIGFRGGDGGGAGGIGHLQNVSVKNTLLYNVTVGAGGLGGNGNNDGSKGTVSSFISSVNDNYLTSTGGNGGYGYYSISGNGQMGEDTSAYTQISYTKAIGGVGYIYAPLRQSGNGGDTIPSSPINTPINKYSFGGGGGGGGELNGGKAGLNGIGGIPNIYSSVNGESGINGAGGGGAAAGVNEFSNNIGGKGGDGVLIIYFQYTKCKC